MYSFLTFIAWIFEILECEVLWYQESMAPWGFETVYTRWVFERVGDARLDLKLFEIHYMKLKVTAKILWWNFTKENIGYYVRLLEEMNVDCDMDWQSLSLYNTKSRVIICLSPPHVPSFSSQILTNRINLFLTSLDRYVAPLASQIER